MDQLQAPEDDSSDIGIVDPNEKIDPKSDPRSAFEPAVLDKWGDYSESLTRGFLKDRICDCWNLTSISPVFPLLQCNQSYFRLFEFSSPPTFSRLSMENCTILWRVAQKFSLEEAVDEMGKAFAQARKGRRGDSELPLSDVAFRILDRRVDSTRNTPSTQSATSQRQLSATTAQQNEGIKTTLTPVPPANDGLGSLTVQSVENGFSSTEAKGHLADLVTAVEEAISRRDKFIVDQLRKEDTKIEQELCGLILEKTRQDKKEEALDCIKKLGSCLDAFDDEPVPQGGARQALKALEEETKILRIKRSMDHESESANLRGKQKRIKTQLSLLEETERTFPAQASHYLRFIRNKRVEMQGSIIAQTLQSGITSPGGSMRSNSHTCRDVFS
ncbi:unnamed protein product [Clonostachys rosea]|uniref:Uncharacterized protein n=1 Tax=Bionectria ochroleuca TaxID=29856 RepID=A0ABY6V0E1_BIOOC|nr:unnamed protein product [Clonostachys rosea]